MLSHILKQYCSFYNGIRVIHLGVRALCCTPYDLRLLKSRICVSRKNIFRILFGKCSNCFVIQALPFFYSPSTTGWKEQKKILSTCLLFTLWLKFRYVFRCLKTCLLYLMINHLTCSRPTSCSSQSRALQALHILFMKWKGKNLFTKMWVISGIRHLFFFSGRWHCFGGDTLFSLSCFFEATDWNQARINIWS